MYIGARRCPGPQPVRLSSTLLSMRGLSQSAAGLWVAAFLVALLGLGYFACAGPAAPSPLTHPHTSSDALARAVLDGIARRDADALRALSLTEGEFRAHVWPELPAARPERNLPFSYVWGDLRQKSETSLQVLLAKHGGQRYELSGVRFAGDDTKYPSYVVHRESVFVVRDQAGAEQQLRLCGSMLEKDGQWKVFSYVVDD
jgi:hypothetical protein